MLFALLKTMRPRQWPKNGFVFVALLFDRGDHHHVLVVVKAARADLGRQFAPRTTIAALCAETRGDPQAVLELLSAWYRDVEEITRSLPQVRNPVGFLTRTHMIVCLMDDLGVPSLDPTDLQRLARSIDDGARSMPFES